MHQEIIKPVTTFEVHPTIAASPQPTSALQRMICKLVFLRSPGCGTWVRSVHDARDHCPNATANHQLKGLPRRLHIEQNNTQGVNGTTFVDAHTCAYKGQFKLFQRLTSILAERHQTRDDVAGSLVFGFRQDMAAAENIL